MPLKITLRPHEKMIIGPAVISNGNSTCDLIIENRVAILRGKDILKEEDAISPAKRIYYVIQLMYLDPDNIAKYYESYCSSVREFLNAVPSAFGQIKKISAKVLAGDYYRAMKLSGKVIEYENDLINQSCFEEHHSSQSSLSQIQQ